METLRVREGVVGAACILAVVGAGILAVVDAGILAADPGIFAPLTGLLRGDPLPARALVLLLVPARDRRRASGEDVDGAVDVDAEAEGDPASAEEDVDALIAGARSPRRAGDPFDMVV
jgi:hypothetical protein